MSYYHKSKPQHHDLQQSQLAGGGGVEAGDGELHEASDRANLRPSHSNLRLTIGQTCWLINLNLSINPMQSTEDKIQNCLKFDPKIMQMRDTLPLFANTCFMFLCLNLMVI